MKIIRRVLVTGGSGFVGRYLVPRLDAAGFDVTVPTRHPERARHLLVLPRVQLVDADPLEPGGLERLVAGQDAVINLIGILHGRSGSDDLGPDFRRIHVDFVQQLIDAMAHQAVRRLVQVSALGVPEDPKQAPSAYLRSRAMAEQRIRASRLDWTIVRPSVIFGPGDSFLSLFASLQQVLPVMMLPGADARFQPVYAGDVAQAVTQVLTRRDTHGATFPLAGPQEFSLIELVRLAGRLSRPGRGARLVLPLAPRMAELVAGLAERMPGPTLLSRDNLRSMRVPNVCATPPDPRLGVTPTPLSEIAPQYLRPVESAFNAERERAGR